MSDTRAAAIGGIIAAVGVLAGTWIEKWLDKDNFDHSFAAQSRNELILKRYQLISDFSNQVNAADYAKILHGWNEVVGGVGPIASKWCQDNSTNEVEAFNCLHDKVRSNSLKYRSDIANINAKFVATLQMS